MTAALPAIKSDAMNHLRRRWWAPVAFLFFLLVAVLATWPLLKEWESALPGSSTDSFVHYWNGWHVRKAVQNGLPLTYAGEIFYPQGVSLVLHNMAWLNIVPWLFFQTFLPGIVAYNVVFLLNLALCGFTATLLIYVLTQHRFAAIIGGMVYLLWPFRFSQLDHPNLISTYWLPLALLFLVLWLREERWRYALAAGVALALVGYTRWQMLIPAAFVLLAYLAATVKRWVTARRKWLGLALAAGVAALLLAPPALVLAGEWQRTITSASDLLREGEEAVMQTDLLAYITPGDGHPVWGEQFTPLYDRYYADRSDARRFPAYMGLLAASLAAIGLWRRWRESFPWLFAALILVGLAAGPTLRIAGRLYPEIPTLYSLLEPLYVVRLIRVPDRFNVTLALPVAVMAGYGAATVLSRFKRGSAQSIVGTLLAALIFLEYLTIPVPLQPVQLSPFYGQLAETTSSGALLNVPIDPLRAKDYMLAQTQHGRPLVQGKVARIPPGAYGTIDGHPWLSTLRQTNEMAPWLGDVGGQLRSLAEDGVDDIIVHKAFAGADRVQHWQRYLIMKPFYEGEEIAVYTTDPQAGVDFALLETLAPGVGPVKVMIADDCLHAGDALAVDVAWGTTQPVTDAYRIELDLRNNRGNTIRKASLPLNSEPLPAHTLLWRYLVLETDSSLPAGEYDLILSLTPNGRAMTMGSVRVSEPSCDHEDLTADAVALDARFGNRLRLLGYTLEHDGDRLQLTLYWRLMQHMETDYKVFVHVFEPQTGVPVAQDDAMPHRGGYPTRFWAAGETIIDHIPLDLGSAPAGEYGVAIGVYDPATLERLPVIDGSGTEQPDGRLVLPEEMITIVTQRE